MCLSRKKQRNAIIHPASINPEMSVFDRKKHKSIKNIKRPEKNNLHKGNRATTVRHPRKITKRTK